jgi:hypothetical protein
MRRLDDAQWQWLANALARAAARVAPDWTVQNAHDPGLSVLELLAYALSELQYRGDRPDAARRTLALRVARLAHELAGTDGDRLPGLQRVNYFDGQLLGADDFTTEQNYFRQKLYRRNRLLHGVGVVSGLQVTLERERGHTRVAIAPGLAFNARGEEIEVTAPTMLSLPAPGRSLLVLLYYAEQACRPVPTPGLEAQELPSYARIAEGFTATLAPSADGDAVALARVNFTRGRWTLDRKFRAAQVRR